MCNYSDFLLDCTEFLESIANEESYCAKEMAELSLASEEYNISYDDHSLKKKLHNAGLYTKSLLVQIGNSYFHFIMKCQAFIDKIRMHIKLFLQKLFYKFFSKKVDDFFKKSINVRYIDEKFKEKIESTYVVEYEYFANTLQLIENAINNAKNDMSKSYDEALNSIEEAESWSNYKGISSSLHITYKRIEGYETKEIPDKRIYLNDLQFTDAKFLYNKTKIHLINSNIFENLIKTGKDILSNVKDHIKKIQDMSDNEVKSFIDKSFHDDMSDLKREGYYTPRAIAQAKSHMMHDFKYEARNLSLLIMSMSSHFYKYINHNIMALRKYIHYLSKSANIEDPIAVVNDDNNSIDKKNNAEFAEYEVLNSRY